ncbi:MAG TPA: allantoinase AllB, partial [Polyangiaceae bacterium]
RVVLPDGVRAASVHVRRGVIARVDDYGAVPEGTPVDDAGDLVVLPGLVDSHVHVNEPGRTEWEGFETATRAAAAGGVTTIADMPLNASPPTTSRAAFEAKAAATEGKLAVDVALTGGVVPGNAAQLRELADAGCVAFKCFLVHSGVDDFPHVEEDELLRAMPVLADAGVPLLVHAELSGPIDEALRRQGNLSDVELARYVHYLESRPREAENAAVELVVKLTRATGARSHVVHLSSSDALAALRIARDEGVRISAETCPHYLVLAAEDVPDGATEYKCAPPIRERHNRERLWEALREGVVSQVVTDHSPSPSSLKCTGSGDFSRAWGGIASLELGLRATWTEGRTRGMGPAQVAEWMSAVPAKLLGLDGRKGSIAAGKDADLVVWEPEGEQVVDVTRMHQRHKMTPYARRTLRGIVQATYLRGRRVYAAGAHVGAPSGSLLRRGRA